ncbi:Methyltransferase type 11 [Pyrenophora seminiperda CCB06]|uniref:Methyltransferase type 11 n=1 Tax=Pyrenophora seminiperda CCB06 TaxID=1302712 RepID=A0A3M7MA15_9PLEO|nr:Methyltransferase type 11 [Pyrenophora seminiperda CCB06]
MLRQVTKHLPGIEQENFTAVRLDPKPVPINAEFKLVGFVLIADETLIPHRLVKQVLADTRNSITSISHTTYERVRLRPICISIATDGKEYTTLFQLALSAITHFNRLRTLLPPSERNVIPMPLPLVAAVCGRYSLFFAIDGEEINIIGGKTNFGDTATLVGC